MEYTKINKKTDWSEDTVSISYGSIDREGSLWDIIQDTQETPITNFKIELRFITESSISIIMTLLLQYSLNVVTIFSVSRLGKDELAALSLSSMTFNLTNAIFMGISSSLDTLCSQAYGAGKKKLVGVHFQRCTAMMFSVSIPLLFFWWNSSAFLQVFVPDKELADLAQLYLRIVSFGIPGYILFETGKRYLQAQGIFYAGQYVLYICTPINIILNYVFVWSSSFGIGFAGTPLATAIIYNLMAALLFCYVLLIDGKQCWGGLQIRRSFENWAPMLSLAFPGVIMMEAEYFAFETLTMCAARLGTDVLAAQSIVSTVCSLASQVSYGVSVASSTRIAIHIGSQCISNARIATRTSMNISLVLGTISAIIISSTRSVFVNLFTDQKEIMELAKTALFTLAIIQIVDTINVVAAGCLRAQGRQRIGSNLNLTTYYLIAVPLAYYLAFVKEMGLGGLWIGLGFGVMVLAMAESFLVWNADWSVVLDEASYRNEVSE